jgi:MFS transporter, OFA family, oxalate/formate antiporter
MAALVIPLANLLPSGPGSWKGVFMVAAGLDLVAACLAPLALKPLRKRLLAAAGEADGTAPTAKSTPR